MIRLRVPDSLDHSVEDFFPPEITDGPGIVLALDNRQPRDAVIEHGGGCHQRGIVEGHINWIHHEKVT